MVGSAGAEVDTVGVGVGVTEPEVSDAEDGADESVEVDVPVEESVVDAVEVAGGMVKTIGGLEFGSAVEDGDEPVPPRKVLTPLSRPPSSEEVDVEVSFTSRRMYFGK